ncbi:hypothetical protein BH23CHL8_BH23CHL8_17700 [soil metagenome]
MEPTRDTTPRQSPANDRSSTATEPPVSGDRDIIQPSSMTRVTWRLAGDKQAGADPGR